jgi:hypothetical protein
VEASAYLVGASAHLLGSCSQLVGPSTHHVGASTHHVGASAHPVRASAEVVAGPAEPGWRLSQRAVRLSFYMPSKPQARRRGAGSRLLSGRRLDPLATAERQPTSGLHPPSRVVGAAPGQGAVGRRPRSGERELSGDGDDGDGDRARLLGDLKQCVSSIMKMEGLAADPDQLR